MKLSKRLQAIADLIIKYKHGESLGDIGTDHAYLPCYLVNENVIQKAYACDIAKGPIQASIETIGSYHLENKVIPLLGSGIHPLLDQQVDMISICGMGGKLIVDILDEFPEYSKQLIETLRQPLEDGVITVARNKATITYPANFTLIASMNPCPCGNYGRKDKECHCSASQISKYLSRISGPIMDRIDIHIEVDSVTYDQLKSEDTEEKSATIKERVNRARQTQLDRYKNDKNYSNAKMSVTQVKKYCKLDNTSELLLRRAFESLNLSARAHDRILKVARTIADLEGCENIEASHIAEAISYRTLDRKYWK